MLGLLALRPWTTYELATQVTRSLINFWPRTERQLYEEPKNLVAHGYARARREKVGNRTRTVYSITREGRAALRRWLDKPGDGPVIEFENLLKVFFADAGTRDQMQRNLEIIRAAAEDARRERRETRKQWLESDMRFPQRAEYSALVGELLNRFSNVLVQWARWAEKEVASWPEPMSDEARMELARRVFGVAGQQP
jgi:DNA-binding PadR family transcriptional regulator